MNNKNFTSLYNKHLSNFIGFGIKLTRSEADAKDLVQESAIKAYMNIGSIDEDVKFKSWFFKIMYNTFVSAYTKKNRRREIASKIGNSRVYLVANDKVVNDGATALDVADIKKCINTLRPETKETFLQHTKGYQYNEIAEKLNIPIGTVKSRISGARKKVQRTMIKLNYPMSIAS